MNYEWDENKAASNLRKHDILFSDAVAVFEDEMALSLEDTDSFEEQRFVLTGIDLFMNNFEIKDEYDMSQAKRGAIVPPNSNQTRITIRIDTDILDWLREKVNKAGGGNYQTIINNALRDYMQSDKESLENKLSIAESTLRRVIREELQIVGLQT